MTTLRAAEKFEKSHLASTDVAPLVESAEAFYVEGFFLTHGTESVLELSQHASLKNKVRSGSYIRDVLLTLLIRFLPRCLH